jgi:enoyl-CoA hydratase/carnithine racemase
MTGSPSTTGATQVRRYNGYDPAVHNRDTPQDVFGPVVIVDRYEDGRIHVITMNRPHRMNSMGGGLPDALYDAFVDFRDDPRARVAILTGAGDRAFSAGADLIATSEARRQSTPPSASGYRAPRTGKSIVPLAEGLNLWKPTIAAINGYAVAGGFMYAMQCDIRIMADHARVGIGEARWNMPGAYWMIPLTRQLGLGSALELTMWGDTQYDAQRCYQLGWAQRVVPLERLLDTAMEYAHRALDMAPRAVRNFKEALYRGYYMEPLVADSFGRALDANLAGMRDSIEGPTAFAEKRRPVFTDS